MTSFEIFDLSKLDKNFYKFDRERLLKTKPIEKRLSSENIDYNFITSQEQFLKDSIKYLTKFAFGLFNYITGEKSPNISLSFNEHTSYCSLSENKVVVNINYLTDKDLPFQLRVDSILGLIFHEFLHKKVTITSIAGKLNIPRKDYYIDKYANVKKQWLDQFAKNNTKKHVLNILEDFRIEKLGIKEFPGYGFFLDELRKFAFYHLSKRFDSLKPKLKKFDPEKKLLFYLLDYLMIKILMPELITDTIDTISTAFTSSSKTTSLDHYLSYVAEVDKYVKKNYSYVYSNDFNDILKAVDDIDKIIKKYVSEDNDLKNEDQFSMGSPYLFGENFKGELSEELKEELEDLLDELVISIDSSACEKPNCTTVKITDNDQFEHFDYVKIFNQLPGEVNEEILKNANKHAKSICSNLGFLAARYNQVSRHFELEEGEIDEDELYSISYNKNIFCDQEDIKGYELDFGYLLDESGSMAGYMDEAITACLAITKALHTEKHINLYGYGHTANHYVDGVVEKICLYKYYNTRERFTNINTLFTAKARSNNADGFAIEEVCKIMMKSKAKKKVLVVISDGSPHASKYDGTKAFKHVQNIVKKYESLGFLIVQICMNNIEHSGKMFTHFIPYDANNYFINDLKSILIKQLNWFHSQI